MGPESSLRGAIHTQSVHPHHYTPGFCHHTHKRITPYIDTFVMADECPICLEGVGPSDVIGIVYPCAHHYHEQCLLPWSTHSNSCPTCRKSFYKINVATKSAPETILRSFGIKDKLQPNAAIDSIPAEYVIPPSEVPHRERIERERDIQPGGVCQVCSSASYALRQRAMVSCVACNASFHVSCLGAASHEPVSMEWFCPVCDCYQELSIPNANRVHVRASSRGPTSVRKHSLVTTDSDLAHAVFEDSLDSLDSEPARFERPSRPNVLNGGVLLRREERALRNLTPEEAHLWEMLERARTGNEDVQLPASANNQPRRKRRRRTLGVATPVEGLSTSQTQNVTVPEASSGSRIGSLMSQIKLRPQRHTARISDERHFAMTPAPPASHIVSSTRLSPMISPVTSDSESESRRQVFGRSGRELTIEQKRVIQKHVRDNLRPLYIPSGSTGSGTITSESEYIRINKSISRKIYSAIISLEEQEGPQIYEDYFNNPSSKLREMVDSCVQRELADMGYGEDYD